MRVTRILMVPVFLLGLTVAAAGLVSAAPQAAGPGADENGQPVADGGSFHPTGDIQNSPGSGLPDNSGQPDGAGSQLAATDEAAVTAGGTNEAGSQPLESNIVLEAKQAAASAGQSGSDGGTAGDNQAGTAIAEELFKPGHVAVIIVNNAKCEWNKEVQDFVDKAVRQGFAKKGGYTLVDVAPYLKKLSDAGLTEHMSVERQDLIDAFAGSKVSYIYVMEIEPVVIDKTRGWVTNGHSAVVNVHGKIIDVQKNKTIYDGRVDSKYDNNGINVPLIPLLNFEAGARTAVLCAADDIQDDIMDVIMKRFPALDQAKQ
ncbi:MAG: hypothetical protein N3A57_00875 [Negativicutes bacterium]|nr:hypothetical protein [Negativicutes bacterium]